MMEYQPEAAVRHSPSHWGSSSEALWTKASCGAILSSAVPGSAGGPLPTQSSRHPQKALRLHHCVAIALQYSRLLGIPDARSWDWNRSCTSLTLFLALGRQTPCCGGSSRRWVACGCSGRDCRQ